MYGFLWGRRLRGMRLCCRVMETIGFEGRGGMGGESR